MRPRARRARPRGRLHAHRADGLARRGAHRGAGHHDAVEGGDADVQRGGARLGRGGDAAHGRRPPARGPAARGYMSTANIMADPMIAKAPGRDERRAHPSASMNGHPAPRVDLLRRQPAGQLGQRRTRSRSRPSRRPRSRPTCIEIGGNMTTAEQFQVQMIIPAAGNCTQILPLGDFGGDVPHRRHRPRTSPAANTELRNAFQPVPAGHDHAVHRAARRHDRAHPVPRHLPDGRRRRHQRRRAAVRVDRHQQHAHPVRGADRDAGRRHRVLRRAAS